MSNLPPPPPPSGGWPQPGQQQPGTPSGPWSAEPGAAPPGGYGAPPGAAGPWGSPSAYAPTGGGYSAPKAGFGARLGALLIDGLIVGLFFLPAVVMLSAGPTELEACRVDENNEVDPFSDEPANAICEGPTNGTLAGAGLLALAAVGGAIWYHVRLTGRTGQTIGAKALGIKVVDLQTGGPIGAGRAFGRYLAASFISGLICGLGYFWMLWDPQKQTWHDKMTNSVVLKS